MSDAEILRVLREHPVPELAEHYLTIFESFCRILLKVLDCGVLATKVFILMYMYRREWTCTELARMTQSHRQKVNAALHVLRKKGLVERVSPHKWRIKM